MFLCVIKVLCVDKHLDKIGINGYASDDLIMVM